MTSLQKIRVWLITVFCFHLSSLWRLLGTHFSLISSHNLNWAEEWWLGLYKDRNPVIATTLFAFGFHEVVYYLRFLPFFLLDFFPSMLKYKIQQNKRNTWEMEWKCLKSLLFSQFLVQFPMQVMFHPMAESFGMKITEVPFPSLTTIAYQVLIFMVFEDFYHYWFHRALHWGPLYKYIHKQHHEFTAPFGMAAEYAHPLETIILGVGTIGGPLLYVWLTGDLHIVSVYAWLTVRLIQTIDAHSGYDFPFSLRRWLPFWAGSDFHDHHHMVFLGNYSSSFRVWDWLFGTDLRYNEYKKRLQAEKQEKVFDKEE